MREARPSARQAGRPRGFDEDAVLARIMELFWQRGFEAVSLSDIVAATGLGKGSLYATFGDKRAMYLAALRAYEASVIAAAVTALTGPSPARDRIAAFMTNAVEAGRGAGRGERDPARGCFLCNAALDLAPRDAETAALVRRGFDALGRALADALAEAEPGLPDTDRASRADGLLATYAGLRVMARAGCPPARLAAIRDAALEPLPG